MTEIISPQPGPQPPAESAAPVPEEQTETDAGVEAAREEAETTPEVPEDERPSAGAVEAESRSADRAGKEADREALLATIEKCLECDPADRKTLLAAIRKESAQNTADGETTASVESAIAAVDKLIFSPEWQAVWQQFDALASRPEFSKIGEKKKQIQRSLLGPVVRGHLEVTDVVNLVSRIDILPADKSENTTQYYGYEGTMFYDPASRKITISEKILRDEHSEVRNGQTVDFHNLDFDHMISHEIGHGLTLETETSPKNNEQMQKQLLDRESRVSSIMIAEAKKMITNADEYKDAQPAHVQNVLQGLKNINATYEALPEETRQNLSLENYTNLRIVNAADEIVADYTAIYLQSDGSFDDFAEKCLILTPAEGLVRYLSRSMDKDGAENTDPAIFVIKKLRGLNKELASPQEDVAYDSEDPENVGYVENKTTNVLAKYPEISMLLGSYRLFYEEVGLTAKRAKGKIQPASESPAETELADDDLIMESTELGTGHGGGYGGGGGRQTNGGVEITNELLATAHAVYQSLNLPVGGSALQINPGSPDARSGYSPDLSVNSSDPERKKTTIDEEQKKAEKAMELAAKKKKEEQDRLAATKAKQTPTPAATSGK